MGAKQKILVKDIDALNVGEVVDAFNVETFEPLKVKKDLTTGIIGRWISTGNLAKYEHVVAVRSSNKILKLTDKECDKLFAEKRVTCYRSSGYREGDKVLNVEEQVKLGVARAVEVILLDGKPYIESDTGASGYIEGEYTL